jgi:Tol biopolymer transport system component/predicted Ser/Thr protein kinase
MPLSKGDRLGPYEILALVGQGGMGEVYRAHDPRLRRDVAIKIASQRFDERFEREARAIAALNHPNICQIYDVGPDYLVMELVEGPTLKERIKEGAIPIDEALRIAEQMAEALAAAHERFIIHRDLKPDNVKIKDDGTVKVLDFGLAKIGVTPTARESEDSPTFSMTFTQPGVILGTAAYMSPEQARGKAVDARSDIWAFGVVLYEMLTARRLFRGEDLTETLASVVKEEPNLSAVPRKVRRLLEACLQKDPTRRLQAIGDRHFLLLEPGRQRFRWLWPVIAGVTALGTAVLAWTHFREAPRALLSLRYQLTRPGDSGFTEFQLSPDGHYFAFVGQSAAVDRLYVRALDSLQDREFPGTDGATYPFWSPDSAHIAFFSQGKLRQVAMAGGPATNIADAPDARGGTWGRDGSIVFAPGVTGTLVRVSASGGAATRLLLSRAGSGDRDSPRFPAFLPDSDRFFYTIEARTREGEGIYVGSLNGDPPVRILPDLSITRFVPSPTSHSMGYILFRRQTTLMAQAFDAAKLKTAGDAFPLADEVTEGSGNNGFADFTVATNGVLIYAAGGNPNQEREIVWLDRGGKRGKSVLKQKGITDFALSPDKTKLLYSLANQAVPGDLWLRDVARGTSQRFTFGPFSAYSPVWSPDSTTAAFTVYPEDRLYAKRLDSAKEEAWKVNATNTYASSWSADAKLLAFSQSGVTTKDDLWLLPLEGERKPRIFKQTPYNERSGEISPDGRWMVYGSDPSGRFEVYIEPMTPGGAQRQISVEGGFSPHWRADGRELYFISDRSMMAVDVKPGPELTFSAPHKLFREPTLLTRDRVNTYQPSPDGSQFLVLLPVGDAPTTPPLTVVTNWHAALHK